MDYEKKYNEILAWAKKYKARLNGVPIEDIFPELRESEDERIRKGLIKLLTVASEAYLVESTGIKKDSYLAYLEKQKWQMMKEAVEGEYGYFSNASKTILPSGKLNLKEDDEVRIIIVKEEE